LAEWWQDLGDVSLTDELNESIVEGLERELNGTDLSAITARRDDLLSALLRLKGGAPSTPQN
jgi:carnitine 3-dehydrogenase